jgi:DNA replication initiation complex subunit (GINS family)
MQEISYEELREVQKKERSTAMLSEIPDDFYARAGALVKRLRDEISSGFAIEKAREYENALKVAKDIYAIREQKVVLRALRAARGANNISGLSLEERAVYEELKEAIARGEAKFDSAMGISPEPEVAAPPPARPAKGEAPAQGGVAAQPAGAGAGVKLRICVALPEFATSSGKMGPFSAGETVSLPRKEADLLVKRKAAEYA